MYKLRHIPLRECISFKYTRHLSNPCLSVKLRCDATPSPPQWLPVSVPGRRLLLRPSPNIQTTSRFYSFGRGTRRERPEGGKAVADTYTAIVDPEKQEEFVFLDNVEAEDPEELLRRELQMKMALTSSTEQNTQGPSATDKQQRALERQLKMLKNTTKENATSESLIEFEDTDFPLDQNIMKGKRQKRQKSQPKVYGTPDMDEPFSDTCCTGCGAVLHCTATDVPGYLPSEKYKALLEKEHLKTAVCQRCYLLTHHQTALSVKMSKEQYRNIVHGIKSQKALVLLIVDLLDVPDSIVPDLLSLVGKNKHIVVLGNKIDLLPRDSENYLHRIKRQLSQYCTDAGIGDNVRDVHLISAKTGYGIENLISSLQRSWKYKGDVYLVGTANAGKSTLFNTLLDSDYCKSKAVDVIKKATISPWPGTTLNLLKFPIINPTPYRMFRRSERLNMTSQQTEEDLSPEEQKRLKQFSKKGYLVGRVGRTFRVETGPKRDVIDFDPDSLALEEYDTVEEGKNVQDDGSSTAIDFTHNELKDAHWLFDTPGIMKDCDVLNLLNEQEVKQVVPVNAIVPQTFVLKPGMVLFMGALGRIDYLEGVKSCWFSVVASSRLPVHITTLDKADAIYRKHAGHTLLGVPMGGEERMKEFPPLVSQEFRLEGKGQTNAIADIKMSSAGWVAVTAMEKERVVLRAHAPEGAGLSLRSPPLLPHIVSLKGERIRKSVAYKPKRPPSLVDTSVSHRGAQKAKVKVN